MYTLSSSFSSYIMDVLGSPNNSLNSSLAHTTQCTGFSGVLEGHAEHSTPIHSIAQHSTPEHARARQSTPEHARARQSTPEHGTARHSTAQHSTAQHSTAQHSTAQHNETMNCAATRTVMCTQLAGTQPHLRMVQMGYVFWSEMGSQSKHFVSPFLMTYVCPM
jgi:hypothetical protein